MNTKLELYRWIQFFVDARTAESPRFVNRDEIATDLVSHSASRDLIVSSLHDAPFTEADLWEKAANYVDWLNADITGQSSLSADWNDGYYIRKKQISRHPRTQSAREVYWLIPRSVEGGDCVQVILNDETLSVTEKTALVQCRIGQGVFRNMVVSTWQRCPVTGCDHVPLLRASHIKPWSVSTNAERLDPFNGLLLSPNVDAAFDKGLISFDHHGALLISPSISSENMIALGIAQDQRIAMTPERQWYMEYHQNHVFRPVE